MNYNQKREKKVLGFIEKIKIPIKLISCQKNYDAMRIKTTLNYKPLHFFLIVENL